MNPSASSSSPHPQGTHWASLARALLRLVLAVLVIALLAAVLYVAALWLYPRLIQPVQQNAAQLIDLSTRQSQQSQQLSDRLGQLQERIATLDAQNSAQAEGIVGLQGQLAQAEQVRNVQATQLAQIDPLSGTISYIATQAEQSRRDTSQLSEQFSGPASPLAALSREVQLVRAMNLVNRARLNLGQNNPGLARQDVASAREMFSALLQAEGLPAESQASINLLVQRADLALSSLPSSPVIAAGDLDILWQMLVAGMNDLPGQPFVLPAGCESGLCNPTPTPTAWSTPTPTAVLTSFSTPTAAMTPTRVPTSTPKP